MLLLLGAEKAASHCIRTLLLQQRHAGKKKWCHALREKHEIARTLEIRSFFTASSSWFCLYTTQSVQSQKDQSSCFIREMPYGECESRMKVHLRMRPSSKPSSALHFDEAKAMVRIDVQKKQSNSGGPTKLYTDQIVFSLDSVIRVRNKLAPIPITISGRVELSHSFPIAYIY